ncbi:MAG TPA: type IV secretory system conjugative DNA transfer family protein [Candidatus Brocadiia bacterium]|nr:type IV secretion system DNA-binding domain-containing protein [Candidatus Brocadiales bacterium]
MDYEDEITYFAETNHPSRIVKFGIKRKDRRYHKYIIGKTGMGKSTLLKNLIVSDMIAGENLAVLDPHGDLVEDLLDYVPEERLKDVVYFNPADLEYPIGLNVLENVGPSKHHLVASRLISTFKKLWPEFWGPRLEYILRNTVLSLLYYEGATLLDVSRMLTNKDFRSVIVVKVKDPELRNFWINEFEKYSAYLKTEAISPILNKVGQFLVYPILRNIIGQKKSTFDIGKIMNEKGILLANLSKGRIGEDVSALLGSLLITAIEFEALKRAGQPEHERKDFYLYLDEFQTFSTMSVAHMLSESRKYHLSLTCANQYLEQLTEETRSAVFGNVGTIISFKVGASDAGFIEREFHDVFNKEGLLNLPRYHIYLKLVIDGVTSRPFSAVTLPPLECGIGTNKDKVLNLSRKRYGRERKDVEKEPIYTLLKPNNRKKIQDRLF